MSGQSKHGLDQKDLIFSQRFMNASLLLISCIKVRSRVSNKNMKSTSICSTASQLEGTGCLSDQHDIQSHAQHPTEQGEVLITNDSNSHFLLPAPAKFCRKSNCLNRAASVDKNKIFDIIMEAHLKRIYVSNRRYVHSLITETEPFDETSSCDLWAACESLFTH